MTLYLRIDGGGTGCRMALADRTGRVLGRGDGGPANIIVNDGITAAMGTGAVFVVRRSGQVRQAGDTPIALQLDSQP